ncbi:glycosyltransferase family 4 protein [Candidatus Lokiarchaeum ossiferum]|uniref:glycosyltransferase family 4 protein n=1 Tax=Candidatus Lokiarchaeum ossiferum TaxID=2951803 RepID=UPI00352CAF3E
MEKKKICIISLGVFPDHKDGAAKLIRGLFDSLKARGHEVTMLTGQWEDGFSDPNIIAFKIPKSRLFWVPSFYRKVRKYLKNNHFDIIHTNGSRGYLPLTFSKHKFITSIHDLGPFEADFVKIPVLKWLERRNAQKSESILTISNIIKEGIVEFMGVAEDKITTVYCGYDTEFHPRMDERDKIRANLNISGPTIYYVGRIAFYKGVDHIIEAFKEAKKEIKDLNLVIGGKPTLKMRPIYEQWKQKYPEVHFIGIVKEEDMASYYSMADVFVTYSYAAEGFGITPIEAIACGTPVICSTMPAYQEILQDNAIFVERQRPDLLAKAFVNFFQTPDKSQEMLVKASEYIKKYTWDAVTDRVENVYQDYLQKNK